MLSNNDLDGVEDVATGTRPARSQAPRSLPRPGPVFTGSKLIAADAVRIAAGLLPELKTSTTLTLSMQHGFQISEFASVSARKRFSAPTGWANGWQRLGESPVRAG